MSALKYLDVNGEWKYVTLPLIGQPISSARWERLTDQSITNGTFTAIIFDQTDHDSDAGDLWSMNMSTGVVTINRDGLYRLSGQVPWRSTGTGHDAVSGILTGSGRTLARHNVWDQGGTFAQGSMLTTGLVRLAAGDTVYLEAYQNTGAALNTYGDAQQGPYLAIEAIAGPVLLDNRYERSTDAHVRGDFQNSDMSATTWSQVFVSGAREGNASMVEPIVVGSVSSTGGYLVAPSDGWYLATATFGWERNAGGNRRIGRILTGTDPGAIASREIARLETGRSGDNRCVMNLSGIRYLVKDQAVMLAGWHDGSVSPLGAGGYDCLATFALTKMRG